MDSSQIGILGILIMLFLFLARVPVAYVMALIGVVGFSVITSLNSGLNLLSRNIYDTFTAYHLTTIPLFIFMGQLAFSSGISSRLYQIAYRFFGKTNGGLSIATVASCTAFGAICGSSPATAATMATVAIPEMKKYKYSDALASGSVASAGGLGMIMPPSVVLIIYGVLTEQSIGKLFMSGIIPALFLMTLFMAAIWTLCYFSPNQGPPGESYPLSVKLKSLLGLTDILLIFLLVVGGMFQGLFTPTEAAAVGVLGLLVLTALKKRLTWALIKIASLETLKTSSMVMFLIAGAVVFGKFLAITRIPFNMATWINSFNLPAFGIMALIILLYFIGGCFMDSLALIMLTIPIFYPVVLELGYNPIWFGIIIVLVTEMGVITPPVGINVYVVYGVAKKYQENLRLESIFKGIIPFFLAIVVGIVFMFIFPEIILFLPELIYGI